MKQGTSSHFVLVGDMIRSRAAGNRPALARKVQNLLKETERRWRNAWKAPLMTTRGVDEISGVLADSTPAFDVAVFLNSALHPQRFRYCLAKGVVDVSPQSRMASAMDGPAFHLAAAGLERARAQRLPFALNLPEQPGAICEVVERAAQLHQVIVSRWTSRQREAVMAYRADGTQSRAGERLNVTQQAVSDSLRRALLHEVLDAEDAIRHWLATVS